MNIIFRSILLVWFIGQWLPAAETAATSTRIATWRDDRTAAFLLMFDDSCPSHWQMAIPAMAKRKLIGTFYLNCGKAEFTKFRKEWANIALPAGMVMGNHTATHQGIRDLANAEPEIGGCNQTLLELIGATTPRLISFAQPGVGPGQWNISGADFEALLAKHHLINRPPFNDHGAVYALKTPAQMLALPDRAIAAKGMEYLIFHGIERVGINWGYQDFWAQNFKDFETVMDGVAERRDRGDLWVTDHISWHQYLKERQAAKLETLQTTTDLIRLELTTSLDPQFYDLPLSLITPTPAGWASATVSQGTRPVQTVTPRNGNLIYQALPGGGPIELHAVR